MDSKSNLTGGGCRPALACSLSVTTAKTLLKETLEDVMDAHRSPESPDYNECEKDGEECQWCTDAQRLLDFFLHENAGLSGGGYDDANSHD